MSDEEDLELAALQRKLDAAFETTRPRAGFEDELWLRMQQRRPASSRIKDAWIGLVDALRQAPAVPMAAVATVLVLIVGVGFLLDSGIGRSPSSTSFSSGRQLSQEASGQAGFGRVPAPAPKLAAPSAAPAGWQPRSPGTTDYPGPAILKWSGTLDVDVATAPVFRYAEPAANAADQFAAALGATLVSRPAGFLGDYQTSTLDIRVTGSIQSPPREPAWVISPIETLPPGDAAGGPAQVALVFLAEHSLAPSWPYETDAGGTPELAVVRFLRQFAVTGYGNASLVDETGARYGMEVDVTSGHPSFAAGPLSLAMDQASYNLISESQALQGGLAMSAPPATPGAPTVVLTTGELVYGLVVAGDQSYYEPEFMFSGAYVVDGKTYVKHVLVPAVDPSQSR